MKNVSSFIGGLKDMARKAKKMMGGGMAKKRMAKGGKVKK